MITVKVTYTVAPEFVETNRKNVAQFIADVKALKNPDITYYSLLGADGKTFTHVGSYANEAAQQEFLALPSFKWFQEQRNTSGLEKGENVEVVEVVAAA
jgi:quinol monooxygenase YgiN